MSIWNKAFWAGVGERTLKTLIATTFGQLGVGVIAAVTGGTVPAASITDYDWPHIGLVDALAVLVSFGIALGNASFTSGAAGQAAAAAKHVAAITQATAATPPVAPPPIPPEPQVLTEAPAFGISTAAPASSIASSLVSDASAAPSPVPPASA